MYNYFVEKCEQYFLKSHLKNFAKFFIWSFYEKSPEFMEGYFDYLG